MNKIKDGLLENKPTALQQKPEPPNRYCLYARKSSESEERQALSIDSQVKEMYKIAERDHLLVVEVLTESHSAKSTAQRPVFNQMVEIAVDNFREVVECQANSVVRNTVLREIIGANLIAPVAALDHGPASGRN